MNRPSFPSRLLGRMAPVLLFVLIHGPAGATTYYADPAGGSMSNAGSAAQPWSTLEAVFAANKTFAPGDIILLRSGYHGFPSVKGNNAGVVTIQPESGAVPKLRKLIVRSGSNWVISGLDICTENGNPGTYDTGNLVDIQSSANHITLENCVIRNALSIAGWSVTDWQTRLGKGAALNVTAPSTTLRGNALTNAGFAISLGKSATNSLVSHNTITNFFNDAMRGLADFCTFEYNVVTNSYVSDANHDDFFQNWSVGSDGVVGHGTVYNVTLRGNIFLSVTDPAQPLQAPPQGVGCFDGMFENWVVENNVISSQTYHGISLYGAINCRIVNNTVIENPITGINQPVRPWILITQHKAQSDGTPWLVPSSGNIVRNNITAKGASIVTGGGTIDHNVMTTAYSTYFTNFSALDFSLSSTSPAIGAGQAMDAPAADILGRIRTVPYDLGAYKYPSAYEQWLQANDLPLDASGSGDPAANPSGDGLSNAMKCALGLSLDSRGYAGRMSAGTIIAGGAEYLSLTFTRPEPPPIGITYTVKTGANLLTWSAADTIQVSTVVTGALRSITIRDTKALDGPDPTRFIRLEVVLP